MRQQLGHKLRERLARYAVPTGHQDSERMTLSGELPLGGLPLCRVELEVITTPQADGERTQLRAHLQTQLASVLRPALDSAGPSHAALTDARPQGGTAISLRERAGGLAQRSISRALAIPGVRRLAEPLLRLDVDTWVEINTSTASLDKHSGELLEHTDKLAELGIRPRPIGDQPHAETWVMEAPDSFAQVSVLQLDERHLPPGLRRLLPQGPGFSMAATVVNSAKRK